MNASEVSDDFSSTKPNSSPYGNIKVFIKIFIFNIVNFKKFEATKINNYVVMAGLMISILTIAFCP